MLPIITTLVDSGLKILDKVIPDPTEREKAKLKLLELQQQGELKEMETSVAAIMAEANSDDKWTSRARPSFLYVVYIMILSCIPMGIIFAIDPSIALAVTRGVEEWLAAIPKEVWTLFGIGYLGYTGARSFDKHKNSQ